MDTSLVSDHISATPTGGSQRSGIVTQSRHFATATATTSTTTATTTAAAATANVTGSVANPANSMSPTGMMSPPILINDKDFRNDDSANDTTTHAKSNEKNDTDINTTTNNNDDFNDISISTIDSANTSWNVTPWLEQQQAQQAQFNQSFFKPLSSHSTGNTEIATNLSMLTQQQQMRQPTYIKQYQQTPQLQLPQQPQLQPQSQPASSQAKSVDDDLIPTAIVIKNIPFAIKKEQLLELMSKMNLPLPYAFNYHFDNGVFRGLAFANFNSIEETSMVVSTMNGKEIEGRKLRVEYKKMLPVQERERIEREKKEKKFQLEEQHRNTSSTSLASLYSTASASQPLNSSLVTPAHSITGANPAASVVSNNSMAPMVNGNDDRVSFFPTDLPLPPAEVDFNNPEVLEFYTKLVIAKDNNTDYSIYLSTLSQDLKQRVRPICSFLDMEDYNDGYILTIRRRQQSATTPLMNFAAPSLIRSHSHTVISTNNNTRLRQLQQQQQQVQQQQQNQQQNQQVQQVQQQQSQLQHLQQQLQMQQTQQQTQQQLQQSQQAQQIQQPFYNSSLGLGSLHHSASTASLNVLRSKPTLSVSGLTAPTTPTVGLGRPGTFPAPFQQQSNTFQGTHHFQQQLTGGSSISMNELYTGMEYLNFDQNNL